MSYGEKLKEIIDYILEDKGHSIEEATEFFHLSRSSINRYIRVLSQEDSPYYDKVKSQLVKDTLARLEASASENAKEKRLNELIAYITEGTGHNITQAAENFGMARSTVTKYLGLLTQEDSLYYDEAKATRVNLVLERLLAEARSQAGSAGRPQTIISPEKALDLRFKHLYIGIDLRGLANEIGCSHMTVYNAINAIPTETATAQDEWVKQMVEAGELELPKQCR